VDLRDEKILFALTKYRLRNECPVLKVMHMEMPGFGELIMILLIVFLLFGAGRIPKIARDLGSGIREFKKALSDASSEPEEKSQTAKTEHSSGTVRKSRSRKKKTAQS
jgi:sec-independent protein translocase protein TatA